MQPFSQNLRIADNTSNVNKSNNIKLETAKLRSEEANYPHGVEARI